RWRIGHARADVEARVGRLVVGDVLPGDRRAVLGIVHQGVDAALGEVGRGVDPQRRVVRLAPDDLFAPVAEQIRGEGRGRLGAVVRGALAAGQQGAPAVLRDRGAVLELPGLV